MSPTRNQSLAARVVALFPWVARVTLDASKALAIQSASGVIRLAGGTLPAARQTDGTGYLYVKMAPLGIAGAPVAVALYWSPTQAPGAAWTLVTTGTITPIAATSGTPTSITGGSSKVFVG